MTTKTAELEAVLYAAGDEGISQQDLCQLLAITPTALRELTTNLKDKLINDKDRGINLIEINHNFKLVTDPSCSKVISQYFQKDSSKNLSQSALEILAIVAYEQPITRVEIDEIRGVNSAGAIQTLVWRGLIKVEGKKEVAGHPNLYVTTDYFLQYFNYSSLNDLPLIEKFTEDYADNEQLDLFNEKEDLNQKIE
ncbi:SMC-Scp complex subunit ScpB [Lactobacillus sp. PV034]|uniref:SMC-Scp complex subunit ScpB n=1 Tax=Lactobacillus sp. PV034 TaxID=2594495 RepID=UPI00223FC01C|nr:SMC-Scp complex subunit ScpB [Lactobacillus sp. PV034]QNQ80488.1 SMC-Scp complex subunit ScpB [Lactobacillus sp. PV034]